MSTTATESRTTSKNFRTRDALWDAAAERAAQEGTNVTAVLNRALEAYVGGGEPETETVVTMRVVSRGGRVVSIEHA